MIFIIGAYVFIIKEINVMGKIFLLIHIINVRSHNRYHSSKSSCFRKIGNNLTTFHSGVIIFINKQRFDDDQDFVHIRSHKVIQFVQNAVDYLKFKKSKISLGLCISCIDYINHVQGQPLSKTCKKQSLVGFKPFDIKDSWWGKFSFK